MTQSRSMLIDCCMVLFEFTSCSPKKWGQRNPNLEDYHSNAKEITITFWFLHITD